MQEITTLGIDLAKNIFWLHGADRVGRKVFSKKISREKLPEFTAQLPKCLIVMEACGSSNYWARKFLDQGHEVKLIAAQLVKPFVKSNKNDANDAEAIVEAASRPQMRFVALKTVSQQNILSLHRIRERLVGARTAMINEIRGLLGEYGVIIPQGATKARSVLPSLIEEDSKDLNGASRAMFQSLYEELVAIDERIARYTSIIETSVKENESAKKLLKIPGVGTLTASAITAAAGNAQMFKTPREMSAWLGLVPRQHSSGGKQKLGGISKRGDRYLRKLLVHGARSVLWRIGDREDRQAIWLRTLIERRGFNRACVALANKNARVICAMLQTGSEYEAFAA